MDAASPLFESYPFHVSKKDAQYVDAIHTSAGNNLLAGCLGMEKAFGHVNFYPNGGKSQPGCWWFGKTFRFNSCVPNLSWHKICLITLEKSIYIHIKAHSCIFHHIYIHGVSAKADQIFF